MIKKLSAVGNSLGLIIEKPILELLRIEKDTPLEITTDGEALIIRPVILTRDFSVCGKRGVAQWMPTMRLSASSRSDD